MQDVSAAEGSPRRDNAALHGICNRDTLGDAQLIRPTSWMERPVPVPGVLSSLEQFPWGAGRNGH